jgi:hypothetical protein
MMSSDPTGVQSNEGHSATDDFITRKYVLPLLRDEATRNRLIAEHKANPIGTPAHNGRPSIGHSDDLIRVIDKFRRAPMKGKYVSVCIKPFADFRIGIVSGVRGEPVKLLEGSFSSQDACEHGIFLKRIADILRKYDPSNDAVAHRRTGGWK